MILQIIYSLECGQELANFPFNKSILKSKETLIAFANAALIGKHCFVPEGWKEEMYYNNTRLPENIPSMPQKIHKLSMCIISGEGEKRPRAPKWYNECNGKIWFHDLHPNETSPYQPCSENQLN